jgi:hypothetical protein
MSGITQLFAGVPVSDLDAGIDWYTRCFGRPPDVRAGNEVLWDTGEARAGRDLLRPPEHPRPDENAIAFAEPPEGASY